MLRRMARLTVSCASMYNGGAERVLSILSDAFAGHYDEVEYVTWVKFPIGFPMNPKVKFHCVEEEAGTKSKWKQMRWFRQHIKETNPDLVLSLLAPFNMLTVASLVFTGRKIVVCERSDARYLKGGKKMRMIRDFLYSFSVGILSQTESNIRSLPNYLQRKCSVIYNPLNMDKRYIGAALKTPKTKTIVTVGRLIAVKNHEMLSRAFKRVLDAHPEYELVIYGAGENQENLTKYISFLGMVDKIKLPGSFPDIWDRILSAEIFVLSSNYEGMPNALLEAMCLGLPCISTRVNGAVDVIKTGENGLLVDVGEEDTLVDALLTLIEDKGKAVKLGEKASQLYKELEYSKISQQWLDYLDDKIAR